MNVTIYAHRISAPSSTTVGTYGVSLSKHSDGRTALGRSRISTGGDAYRSHIKDARGWEVNRSRSMYVHGKRY